MMLLHLLHLLSSCATARPFYHRGSHSLTHSSLFLLCLRLCPVLPVCAVLCCGVLRSVGGPLPCVGAASSSAAASGAVLLRCAVLCGGQCSMWAWWPRRLRIPCTASATRRASLLTAWLAATSACTWGAATASRR